jgi:hypothetical protein
LILSREASVHYKPNYFYPNRAWQFQGRHSSICSVYLVLVVLGTEAELTDNQRDIPENIGVNQRAENDHEGRVPNLKSTMRVSIVACHLEHRNIDTLPVLIGNTLLIKVDVRHPSHRWPPLFINRNDEEPQTCGAMDVHEDEEHELEQQKEIFLLFFNVHSRD